MCVGLVSLGALAAAAKDADGFGFIPGEGVSFNDRRVVSADFSLACDSKYLTYGLVDNPDPILTPAGSLTFLDCLDIGVSAIMDTTKYGVGADYGNRAWTWTEIDPEIGLAHSFSPDDFEWLPTCVDLSLMYMYEHHPDSSRDDGDEPDTQFVTFEAGLPDLWIEPVFVYEQDVMRDSGSYLNLEIGHTFPLIDGGTEDDDPVLSLKPSVAQGWGDCRRVRGYLSTHDDEPLNRAGLMDSRIQLAAEWSICDFLSLSGYVAYSDYLFDRHTRDAARRYEATGKYDRSFNFICGLRLTASF